MSFYLSHASSLIQHTDLPNSTCAPPERLSFDLHHLTLLKHQCLLSHIAFFDLLHVSSLPPFSSYPLPFSSYPLPSSSFPLKVLQAEHVFPYSSHYLSLPLVTLFAKRLL